LLLLNSFDSLEGKRNEKEQRERDESEKKKSALNERIDSINSVMITLQITDQKKVLKRYCDWLIDWLIDELVFFLKRSKKEWIENNRVNTKMTHMSLFSTFSFKKRFNSKIKHSKENSESISQRNCDSNQKTSNFLLQEFICQNWYWKAKVKAVREESILKNEKDEEKSKKKKNEKEKQLLMKSRKTWSFQKQSDKIEWGIDK